MPYDIILGRDASDKEKFGSRGLVHLGKGYVTMGNYTSLSNNIWMDVARSHVVLVAGKRGSGKCLHGDTLITLADGSQVPIKELENNKEKIISLNSQLKIETSEKSEFFSREVQKLLKVTLRSGKEIKLTPEHPLLTIKGWEEAQKLNVGSRIATPRTTPTFGSKEMPEHEVKLLSYLIAEGHTKSVVLFTNSDEKIVDEFRKSLKQFDSSLDLVKEKEYHYRISSHLWKNVVLEHNNDRDDKGRFQKGKSGKMEKRSIRKLIEREELFGKLAPQKYLSNNILTLNKNKLSLFLNRLFSCDGSVYYKKTKNGGCWQISYASSSERLIRQIQNLLLRFNILSKLRNKKIKLNGKEFNSHELVLGADNVVKFIEQIGFFGKKEERQKIALESLSKTKRNPNVDTIPQEVWKMYKPRNWAAIGRALNYTHPKAMRERIHYSPSRQMLAQIAEVEKSNPLRLLSESDIFWDEIVKVELLEGKFTVYDICVPENHNFVANDIIVHNSYTLGVIAEELANLEPETARSIGSLIFDTMGIFWTMKFKNEKDSVLLREWNKESKSLPIRIFVPSGKAEEYTEKEIPFNETFALKASELEAEDWITAFNLTMTSQEGVLIERTISSLKEQGEFTIQDIQKRVSTLDKTTNETKNIASSLFNAAESWGIFAQDNEQGTIISNLVKAGETSVLDLSVYSATSAFNVRALVIGLVSRKLFEQRMDARKKEEIESIQHGSNYLSYSSSRQVPLVWLFIDEAHEFLPRDAKTPATEALVQILREGRQPGISLVLATQQPGQIHRDVMTQSDIVISHRVTSQQDLESLNQIMQSYVLESIKKKMDELPSSKGSAIILDDNSERMYSMRMRPRFTWHGGESPAAVKADSSFQ